MFQHVLDEDDILGTKLLYYYYLQSIQVKSRQH